MNHPDKQGHLLEPGEEVTLRGTVVRKYDLPDQPNVVIKTEDGAEFLARSTILNQAKPAKKDSAPPAA